VSPSRTRRDLRRRTTPTLAVRAVIGNRSVVNPSLRRGYRALLGGGLAIVLAGASVATAATWPDAATQSTAASYVHSLESTPPEDDPADPVRAPRAGDVRVADVEARAELAKESALDLREIRAAHRAAQRQAMEQQARERAQAEAARAEQRSAEEPRAAASAADDEDGPSAAPQAAEVSAGGERGALAGMVNSLRSSNGRAGLSRDPSLDAAAQGWAQWMASNRTLQHNPNLRADVGGGWSRTGENIVRNTGAQSWSSSRITSWMFNWWSNSSVHRANMLNDAYTHIGVGYAMGSGGPYAVLVFGAR